jgi:hypothetical protein
MGESSGQQKITVSWATLQALVLVAHAKRADLLGGKCVFVFLEPCELIPPSFNDVDSWKESISPCCHCRSFRGDRALKKKMRNIASYHDEGLAEPYRCQSLWEVRPVEPVKCCQWREWGWSIYYQEETETDTNPKCQCYLDCYSSGCIHHCSAPCWHLTLQSSGTWETSWALCTSMT